MFRASIQTSPFVCDGANGYFENRIYGDAINGDYSFLSTLRALLDPRMGKDDQVWFSYSSSSYSASQADGRPANLFNAIIGSHAGERNNIHVHSFRNGTQENNDAWIRFVIENFEKTFSGWKRVEKATLFYRKVFQVVCFVNPELKSTILFTDTMDNRKMHFLQCGLFAYFPWYFDPAAGVSKDEMALIESLRKTESNEYEELLAKMAEKYDFKTAMIKKMLSGFELRYERQRIEQINREIREVIDNINRYNAEIGNLLRSKSDKEITLLGLETKVASGSSDDSEIMEYFLCNKRLELESVDTSTMRFSVFDYLTYFDEDIVSSVLKNTGSFVYRSGAPIKKNDMALFTKAVFLDQSVKIRTCAAYSFDLRGSVRTQSGHDFGSRGRGYLPNPHINRYDCMGNYQRTINELLKNRDYIAAIEQCIASAKSLNFGDYTVMSAFYASLYNDPKCVELPDGSVVKVSEAISYLKSAEKKEEA